MSKIGRHEVSDEPGATYYTNSTKEDIVELLIYATTVVAELEEELELTNEICDDLRTEVEQKDNTIRSLVDVTTLLARRLPA